MCRTRRTRLVFKGGTSLLKAHGLITRFTQDVDLVVVRAELGFAGNEDPMKAFSEVSKKQRQRLIERKAERAPCGRCDPEVDLQTASGAAQNRTLVHLDPRRLLSALIAAVRHKRRVRQRQPSVIAAGALHSAHPSQTECAPKGRFRYAL